MEELKASLELDRKKARMEELEAKMEEPDFWSDPEKAQEITKELKGMKDTVDSFAGLESTMDDAYTMIEMGYEENDASLIPEIGEMIDEFKETFETMRIQTLLSGEYDSNHRHPPCRCRRHRVLRLGGDALPHVYQMGGEPRL